MDEHVRPVKPGDRVYVIQNAWIGGRVATVMSVSGDGINPCPCCGFGLGLSLGDPNVRYGSTPADVVVINGALVVAGGVS